MGPRAALALTAAITITTLCSACSDAGSGTSPSSSSVAASAPGFVPLGSAALRSLTVSSGALVPAFDPSVSEYEITSLNALFPVEVTAATVASAASIAVDGVPATSGEPVSLRLSPRQDLVVTTRAPDGDARTYTVHYVPASMPAYEVWSDPARAGSEAILLTPNGSMLLMVDRSGAPLYYRSFAPSTVGDFQRHVLADGRAFYSATVGTASTAWTLGTTHLMDDHLRDVADLALLPNRAHDALPAEEHDFALLGDDDYVVMSYVQRTVDMKAYFPEWSATAPVMHCLVQEIDHGAVVFEWDSADFPSLYGDSTDGNAFSSDAVSDYLHLNSIDVDPHDGNFVFSLRHTNSIVKVDRKTAQIVWTLGGAEDQFGLAADQRFVHQHHVRVQADGSLSIFDNGNGAHQTRVLELSLDESAHVVTSSHVVYGKPADEPATTFMGSATRLGATRELIGWGGWTLTPGLPAPPSVTEIVDGAPSWSLTFDSPKVYSYRALPIALPP